MTKPIVQGKGHGFIASTGKTMMIKCFKCGAENYAMAVASGYCAFCGYTPNKEEDEKDKSFSPSQD